jgi:hypothetical protein
MFAIEQARDAFVVEAVYPISERLTIHSALTRRVRTALTLKD